MFRAFCTLGLHGGEYVLGREIERLSHGKARVRIQFPASLSIGNYAGLLDSEEGGELAIGWQGVTLADGVQKLDRIHRGGS